MRAFFAFLVIGFTALVSGFIGFQAGIASNIGAAGGTVWLGGWFPGLGFLFFPFFFLLFVGLLALAFGGGRRRGWGPGYGHPGHGRWGEPGPDDPRRQWIADAHRRLHEEDARRAGATGTDTPSGDLGGSPTSDASSIG